MTSKLANMKIAVMGGTGYVGRYLLKTGAANGIKMVSVSRKGKSINCPNNPLISYFKGDSMQPDTYKDSIRDCDAVIHTIGTLIDSSISERRQPGQPGTYEHMNRDTALMVGKTLATLAKEQGVKKRMIYISGSANPPFITRYLSTKLEAEKLLNQIEDIGVVSLRPGFIYNYEDRSWSLPLKFIVDADNCIMGKVMKFLPNGGIKTFANNFYTDRSVSLDDVAHSALFNCVNDSFVGKFLHNRDIETSAAKFKSDTFTL